MSIEMDCKWGAEIMGMGLGGQSAVATVPRMRRAWVARPSHIRSSLMFLGVAGTITKICNGQRAVMVGQGFEFAVILPEGQHAHGMVTERKMLRA